MQEQLRRGDSSLAGNLFRIVAGHEASATIRDRSLALETLAAARAPLLDQLVLACITHATAEADEDLRYAAIAAASNLPSAYRSSLISAMRHILDSSASSPDVRSAASAFLNYECSPGSSTS